MITLASCNLLRSNQQIRILEQYLFLSNQCVGHWKSVPTFCSNFYWDETDTWWCSSYCRTISYIDADRDLLVSCHRTTFEPLRAGSCCFVSCRCQCGCSSWISPVWNDNDYCYVTSYWFLWCYHSSHGCRYLGLRIERLILLNLCSLTDTINILLYFFKV